MTEKSDLMKLARNNREKFLSIVDHAIETFEKMTKNASSKKLLEININAVGVHLAVEEQENQPENSETKEAISPIVFAKNLNEAQIFLSAVKNTKADINNSNVRDVSNFCIAIREGIEWGMCIAKCQTADSTKPETPATEPETDPNEQITPFDKMVNEIQTFLADDNNQLFASWFEGENETKIEIVRVAEEIQEGISHFVGYDCAEEKHCLGGAVITGTSRFYVP
jgi:hypothetical protein